MVLKAPRPEDATVAAVFALVFAVYLVVLQLVLPSPTDAEWAAADPILTLLPRASIVAATLCAALVATTAWWRIARPDRQALRRGLIGAAVGGGGALCATLIVRLVVGETFPDFVPPEESSAPGFVLSMAAGLDEELACRTFLLQALFFALRSRTPSSVAAGIAVGVTGLAFALWHSAGEGALSSNYFATRLLFPGCFMSIVWLVSPSAIVVGHATAHIVMPALFAAS